MKLCVPSIGSMNQRTDRPSPFRAELLADDPVVGERGADALADTLLHLGVRLGHERPIRLGIHLQVAAEVATGDGVGLVAGGLGDLQPATDLGIAATPERGGPVDPERLAPAHTTAHDRIRSPVGSYSGSRATSNPTCCPKTSTSPRVPNAAMSGGRYA